MNKSFAFENYIEYNHKFYFYDYLNDTICMTETWKEFYLDVIDNTFLCDMDLTIEWGKKPRYSKIYRYKDKIVLLPMIMEDFLVFDINGNKQYRRVNYDKNAYHGMVFQEGYVIDNKLYAIPCAFNKIIEFDLESEVCKEIIIEEFDYNKYYAWGSSCESNGRVIFGEMNGNRLFEFDPEMGKITFRRYDELNEGCGGVWHHNGVVYVIPAKTKAVFFIDDNHNLQPISIQFPQSFMAGKKVSFSRIISLNDDVVFLPRDANEGLIFSYSSNSIIDFPSYRIDMIKEDRLNRYMPISYVWKAGNDYVGNISYTGDLIYLFTGEKYEYRVYVETDVKLQLPSGVFAKEENNRRNSLRHYLNTIS